MRYLGAVDQGTSSTRFILFDDAGAEVARHQLEHRQILPRAGWVEHDPDEIIHRTREVMAGAMARARASRGVSWRDVAAVGITNQRETTVVWNPTTGRPWYNAIVWQDTRTAREVAALEPHASMLRARTGLPPATYFSAPKLRWILDHVDGVRDAAARGEAIFGTIDTWVVWNLTGGVHGGRHATDVTNASRTQLMNLRSLEWDGELLELFTIPRGMLPAIYPSSDATAYGTIHVDGRSEHAVPITGVLGDQQAALLGQACVTSGDAKNTYGTGNFLLLNTGTEIVPSAFGLLTTACWSPPMPDGLGQRGVGAESDPALIPHYGLEGSIAVTGSAVQWLRDQLGVIATTADVEPLAASVDDTAGAYFVPAFSGLFAPHWRPDARGLISGLTRYHTKAHLARATLEAICFQTRDVLEAMTADAHLRLDVLKVDGGATVNNLLMQLQADILGVPVVRPVVRETTALGASYAAGLAVGIWRDAVDLRGHWRADRQWEPAWSDDRREAAYSEWKAALRKSLRAE